jgi:tetratricopeptide (TPR) repeat protein
MRIKVMRKIKAISALLLTLAVVLTSQQANSLPSGSRYVLPPSAPSNWIINPANPLYLPRPNNGSGQRYSAINSLYIKASEEKYNRNYGAAFQTYTKIISVDPQAAQAYFNRGSIKQDKLNDRAGALEDFQTAYGLFQQKGDKYMIRASMEHIRQLSSR